MSEVTSIRGTFSPLYIGVSGATLHYPPLHPGVGYPFSPLYIGVSGATRRWDDVSELFGVTFSPLYIGVSGATVVPLLLYCAKAALSVPSTSG